MNEIMTHFEEEAPFYDEIILKLIPHYSEMVNALSSLITFEKETPVYVLDLGYEKGTSWRAILERYPNAKFTIN